MKILFTGASSFTGFWFIQELVKRGHTVLAVCRKECYRYEGVRKQRIEKLVPLCDMIFGCEFGSKPFLTLLKSHSFDLFCHHAAEVHRYKSPDFDCLRALNGNTRNLAHVLNLLQKNGGRRVVLTGSVFEPREGGDPESRALSLYGLSKGLTSQIIQAYVESRSMSYGKFVISNPFGPYEEFRFTSYLALNWMQDKTPIIATPDYLRDNIPIDKLSLAYATFVESDSEINRPHGYIETQGSFTKRFSQELSKRLNISCPFELKKQTDFSEPLVRINSDPILCDWDEEKFWDALADYYNTTFRKL